MKISLIFELLITINVSFNNILNVNEIQNKYNQCRSIYKNVSEIKVNFTFLQKNDSKLTTVKPIQLMTPEEV